MEGLEVQFIVISINKCTLAPDSPKKNKKLSTFCGIVAWDQVLITISHKKKVNKNYLNVIINEIMVISS